MKVILMFFTKNFCLGQMGHLCPKMAHPDNSGSALRFVFKFCTMKGANKYMEIIFKKKSYSGKLGHFGPKMVRPHNFGSPLRYFFYFAQ